MSKIKYPYKVDYNDHFETPEVAYRDILPLLDAVHTHPKQRPSGKSQKSASANMRGDHIIYDPYYCNGRTKRLLESFGFNVVHEKRDFYTDVKNNNVPKYHTLVTNPPYSSDHKERCVQFAMDQARNSSKSFFLLMPNYVACRNYFQSVLKSRSQQGKESEPQILYVVPFDSYEYVHPEGTGKDFPPFASIWFCGVPSGKADELRKSFEKEYSGKPRSPRLASSLDELHSLGAVPTVKRKNLKQRLKAKRKLLKGKIIDDCNMKSPPAKCSNSSKMKVGETEKDKVALNSGKKRKKISKYRDEGGTGKRNKKRF